DIFRIYVTALYDSRPVICITYAISGEGKEEPDDDNRCGGAHLPLSQGVDQLPVCFHVESVPEFTQPSQEGVHDAHHQTARHVDGRYEEKQKSFSGLAVVELAQSRD